MVGTGCRAVGDLLVSKALVEQLGDLLLTGGQRRVGKALELRGQARRPVSAGSPADPRRALDPPARATPSRIIVSRSSTSCSVSRDVTVRRRPPRKRWHPLDRVGYGERDDLRFRSRLTGRAGRCRGFRPSPGRPNENHLGLKISDAGERLLRARRRITRTFTRLRRWPSAAHQSLGGT